MKTVLSEAVGALTGAGIRQWVRLTGKRVARRDAPWLDCPMGPRGRIGAEFYNLLAQREQLHLRPAPDAGLLPDFDALKGSQFDPAKVRPEVRDFYEHTSCYRLEAWSEAPVLTRLFLWGLTKFVSRRMDQLNFPVSSLELAGGMTSEVLPMVEPTSGRRVYTGWLRRLAAADRVAAASGRPLSPDAYRKQLSRARRLFAQLIVNEVGETLESPTRAEVLEELAEIGLRDHVVPYLAKP
jgi:hypothetical protein